MLRHKVLKRELNTIKLNECWESLQFVGLKTAGFSAIRKPLLFGGNASFQIGGKPFSGRKDLIVNQGGLRNKEASQMLKRLFKEKVKPVLAAYLPGLGQGFNGKFELHFGEGVLQGINLTTI